MEKLSIRQVKRKLHDSNEVNLESKVMVGRTPKKPCISMCSRALGKGEGVPNQMFFKVVAPSEGAEGP